MRSRRWIFGVVGFLLVAVRFGSAQNAMRVESLQRAADLMARHDYGSAEAALQKLLKDGPDGIALNLLGLIRVQQQKPVEAEALFREAIATKEPILGPHVNLARMYAVDRPVDAIGQCAEALKIAPDHRETQELLRATAKEAALRSVRAGDRPAALAIVVAARNALPQDAEMLFEFAMVEADAGYDKDAERALEQDLALRPGDAPARYALARVLLNESQAQPAEQEMRKYLELKPDDSSAQYGLGYILVAEEKPDEAKAALQQSLALAPNQTESVFQLGLIAAQQGKREEARDQFAQVLARDPQHAGALTELGELEYKAGHYDRAQDDLRAAVASRASYQKAHYYYALTLAKLGNKTESEHEFAVSRSLQGTHKAAADLTIGQR